MLYDGTQQVLLMSDFLKHEDADDNTIVFYDSSSGGILWTGAREGYMSLDISAYLITKVLRITVSSPVDKKIIALLPRLNNLTFTNGQERTYVESQGVRIATLDYGKTASLSGESALISDDLLALQTGTAVERVTNDTSVLYGDTVIVNGNTATTKFTATGTSGNEIAYVYTRNKNGSLGEFWTQDAATGAKKFTYTPSTKELSFDAGEIADGTKLYVVYHPTIAETKVVSNSINEYSLGGDIRADVAIKDPCDNSKTYLGQLIMENGSFSGAFEWTIDGTSAMVQSFTIDSMPPCDEDNLWKLVIYDEADIA